MYFFPGFAEKKVVFFLFQKADVTTINIALLSIMKREGCYLYLKSV